MDTMNTFGYIGILLLIALENLFPPIPSEVILTFGGFMTLTTDLTITGVIIFATIGSVIGAIILYWIGTLFDVERMERIIERWGHYFKLDKTDIHKANGWFDKYGPWTVFFCRFIPLIRSLISIPAGMSRMNFFVFILLTACGTLIWNIVLVNIGASVGASWGTIVSYIGVYANIIYSLLAFFFIVTIIFFIKRKR